MKLTITKINVARSHSKLRFRKLMMNWQGWQRDTKIISDLKDILKCKVGWKHSEIQNRGCKHSDISINPKHFIANMSACTQVSSRRHTYLNIWIFRQRSSLCFFLPEDTRTLSSTYPCAIAGTSIFRLQSVRKTSTWWCLGLNQKTISIMMKIIKTGNFVNFTSC